MKRYATQNLNISEEYLDVNIRELYEENNILNNKIRIYEKVKDISDEQIILFNQQISELQNYIDELKLELLEQRYMYQKISKENIELKTKLGI